jgi:hypothetical protein
VTLGKSLAEEGDTGEAFEIHRELVTLLVENIALSRNEDGKVKFDIIYRGSVGPMLRLGGSAYFVQSVGELARAREGEEQQVCSEAIPR